MQTVGMITIISAILAATVRMATPIIYAGVGEVFSERSGVINIGLEGIMLLGAIGAYATAYSTGNLWLGILVAVFIGLLCGIVFALFTVTIKANQIVVGTAFNLVGAGLSGFLYRSMFVNNSYLTLGLTPFPDIKIPFLNQIPLLGDVLFDHNFLVYGTLILVPLATFILNKTAFGLAVRSVGEHPKAADTMGINVNHIRYICILIGTSLASVGGATLSLAFANQFVEGITTGRGFIALAAVVFGSWKPWGVTATALLFGFFYALQLRVQAMNTVFLPYQLLQALPYVATILVLISIRNRSATPKALGIPYKS